MTFDNLGFMSVRDRAGMQPHERLYNISSGPNAPGRGQEFAQVIAEAAGLNGEGALATRESDSFFGPDGFGFDDFIDLINPLQHIPIVLTIYRDLTGDTIADGARIFGGPLGFAAANGDTTVKQAAGRNIGELAFSLFKSNAPKIDILTAGLSPQLQLPKPAELNPQALSNIAPSAGSQMATRAESNAAALSAFAADLAGPSAQPTPAASLKRPHAPPFIDRMTDAQKALLLSSVGISPESTPRPSPQKASGPSERQEIRRSRAQELFQRSAAQANETPNITPAKNSTMAWPDSAVRPGIDPNSPEWVAKAMSNALDKYEKAFEARQKKNDQVDSKI